MANSAVKIFVLFLTQLIAPFAIAKSSEDQTGGKQPSYSVQVETSSTSEAGWSATLIFSKKPNSLNCGVAVVWGDGQDSKVRLYAGQTTRITHQYASPGRYEVSLEGRLVVRGLLSVPPCFEDKQSIAITLNGAQSQIATSPHIPITSHSPIETLRDGELKPERGSRSGDPLGNDPTDLSQETSASNPNNNEAVVRDVLQKLGIISSGYEDERRYAGDRFLSLANLKVREKPSAKSRIIYDIKALRIVYGTYHGNDWVKINGVGTRKYPDEHQGLAASEKITHDTNGFSIPRVRDRDRYIQVSGFVKRNEVGEIDEVPKLPAVFNKAQSIPSLWDNIPETRKVPTDPTASPFSSVVQFQAIELNQGRERITGLCSGFFIENAATIVTAGHCISKPRSGAYNLFRAVIFPGSSRQRSVDLRLIASEHVPGKSDWALFVIPNGPVGGITPLHLPSGGSWTRRGGIQVAQIGFGGDLTEIKQRMFDALPVHFDICKIPVSTVSVRSTGMKTRLVASSCLSTNGDSGGPLVFWNDDSKRYEILGIVSDGIGHEVVHEKAFSPSAFQRYLIRRAQIMETYRVPQTLVESIGIVAIPGITPIAKASTNVARIIKASDDLLIDRGLLAALREHNIINFDPDAFLAKFSVDLTALDLDRELEQLATLSSKAVDDFRHGNNLRSKFLESAFFGREGKFLDQGLHEKFDFGRVKSHGLNTRINHFAVDGDSALLVEPSEVAKAMQILLKTVADPKHGHSKERIDSFARQLPHALIVQVESDVFFVEKDTGVIVGIVRDWINEFEGDIQKNKTHPSYPLRIDSIRNKNPVENSNVVAQNSLKQDNFGSETPASIPGGRIISTAGAWQLLSDRDRSKVPIVLSAMSDTAAHLPGALDFSEFSAGGTFNDSLQAQLNRKLAIAKVSPKHPVLVYCHGKNCWSSYNLALRLINLGFDNVYWYRDGIEGWYENNLPVARLR